MNELATLYRYRQLIAALTVRDLKARYRGSILGFFWSLANPLLLLGVYTLVFTIFFPQQVVKNYPLFLFAGILPWTFFSNAVTNSGNSLVGSSNLITKVYFPRMIIPGAAVGAGLVDFAIAFIILIVLMGWQFALAEFAGGPLMVAIVAVLFRLFLSRNKPRNRPTRGSKAPWKATPRWT